MTDIQALQVLGGFLLLCFLVVFGVFCFMRMRD